MKLEGEAKWKKIPKQEYTAEFRELAVKRGKPGQSIGVVARELGLIEQTLGKGWGAQSAVKPALWLGQDPLAPEVQAGCQG